MFSLMEQQSLAGGGDITVGTASILSAIDKSQILPASVSPYLRPGSQYLFT